MDASGIIFGMCLLKGRQIGVAQNSYAPLRAVLFPPFMEAAHSVARIHPVACDKTTDPRAITPGLAGNSRSSRATSPILIQSEDNPTISKFPRSLVA